MIDLLPLTLEGTNRRIRSETPQLRWTLAGEGVLELMPRQPYRQDDGHVGGRARQRNRAD